MSTLMRVVGLVLVFSISPLSTTLKGNAQTAVVAKSRVQVKEELASVRRELKQSPAAKFSMQMIERDHIDPGYAGVPAAEVVAAIEKLIGLVKGEFESTSDFNARKAAALTEKFLGGLSMEDTFAFVVPVERAIGLAYGLKYSFNADTSEVRLFALVGLSSMNGIGGPGLQTSMRPSKDLDQLKLDTTVSSPRTYEASNAFGASVTVKESTATTLGIAANRIPFLTYARDVVYFKPVPSAQFNMENAKAAKELPALKALVVMKLADPYVVYNFVHIKPTRDKPREITWQEKFLSGDVLGILFYSGLTGEVFARLPSTFGLPEQKLELGPKAKPAGQ